MMLNIPWGVGSFLGVSALLTGTTFGSALALFASGIHFVTAFAPGFVLALIAMLLNGTLVPLMVTAPKCQVTVPSETVLDSAGGGGPA